MSEFECHNLFRKRSIRFEEIVLTLENKRDREFMIGILDHLCDLEKEANWNLADHVVIEPEPDLESEVENEG